MHSHCWLRWPWRAKHKNCELYCFLFCCCVLWIAVMFWTNVDDRLFTFVYAIGFLETSYKLTCTYTQTTFDIVTKLEQRRHLRQRRYTPANCVLFLIPFGIGYWHQTLTLCWACTNFATMLKDTANNSRPAESKLTRTHCRSDLAVCFCVLEWLLIQSRHFLAP